MTARYSWLQPKLSRKHAITKATKIRQGNVLKAALEKADNQVVRDVRIEESNHSTASVQIDSRTEDVVKSLDRVE